MRTRHTLLVSLGSAMLAVLPSFAGAQRVVTRDCPDPYSVGARRYADCRYEVERSRAVQRAMTRERAANQRELLSRQRERARWDGIVREARAQARAYDLAQRTRQRAAERVERARVERESRALRIREQRETMLRNRSYRVRW